MTAFLDQLWDELRSAWRFRWMGLAVAGVLAVAGWTVVLWMPDRHEATARVFVDTRTAFEPVLQGLIVDDDVMTQLSYVRQSILTGERLERIARTAGFLDQPVDSRQKSAILGSLAGEVTIDAERAGADAYQASGTVYSITYQDQDPQRASVVVSTVMDTFIRETLGGKQENTEATQEFLLEQIKDYERRLRDAENQLAEFKKKNMGLMPTDRGDYFAQLQAETDQARKVQNDLDVALARRSELARQLRGDTVLSSAAAADVNSETMTRIRQTQARLDDLLLRFTDRHPDVIEARNTLAELKVRRDAELESLRRGDAGAAVASGLSSNPIYQSIQLQLNQVDVEIASLRGQVAQHNAKAAELRQRLDVAPRVEAEYAQLNRDYDINKAQYTALLENYEKSRLGQRADDAGGVRFQIVQRPITSLVSVSAHRGKLLVVALLGALCAGAACAYLMNQLRPVIASVRDLSDLSELPVLGVVGPAFPALLRGERRRAATRFGLALSLLFVGLIVVMILNLNGFRLTTIPGAAP